MGNKGGQQQQQQQQQSSSWDDWDDDDDGGGVGSAGNDTQRSKDSDLDSLLAELGDDDNPDVSSIQPSNVASLPNALGGNNNSNTGGSRGGSFEGSKFGGSGLTKPTTTNTTTVPSTSPSSNSLPSTTTFTTSSNQHAIGTKQKCKIPFCGGTSYKTGICLGVMSQTVCPRMRCTQCNFLVCRFTDKEWEKDVDYIFFRNNSPDEQKLKVKYVDKEGSAAYCCQCNWISATELKKVSQVKSGSYKELRWVCAGHA
ncbi:hypothetical protein TL16_g08256 [Triparma laevis f. inornata]|uniref:Cilia- and flagella-associated protein 418 n=1 Tax=Triparma laevis f. inornata TaxID=1714386 RepID=A0A9W7B268_9STRA|nr:hypothetical protein TL16_g08256 [Triparma laevis f. inornata]